MTKRLFVLVLAVLFLFASAAIYAGAQQEGDGTQEDGEGAQLSIPEGQYAYQVMDTDPYELDLYFHATWATGYQFTGDELTAQIVEDKTGVSINVSAPTGNAEEFLNLMVASGDLPEVMVIPVNNAIIPQLAENDVIYSYQDLSRRYAPNFMELIPDEIESFHAQADGELYYLPAFHHTRETWERLARKVNSRSRFVRSDIYEAIGRPPMDSPENVLAALEQVQEQFPDVRLMGFRNYGGLTASVDAHHFFYAFGEFKGNTVQTNHYYEDENGDVKYPWRSPAWLETMEFLNEAYRRGFIEEEEFIHSSQQYNEKVRNAEYFYPGITDRGAENVNRVVRENLGEEFTYESAGVFKVPGREPTIPSQRGLGWVGAMITNAAEDLEKVTQFMQYRWSEEGQIDAEFGIQGETYTLEDWSDRGFSEQTPIWTDEVFNLMINNRSEWAARYGFDRSFVWRDEYIGQRTWLEGSEFTIDLYEEDNAYAADYIDEGYFNVQPTGATDEAVIHQEIKDIWETAVTEMTLAETDDAFMDIYEAAVEASEEAGAAQVEDVFTQNRNETREKLGG